MITKQHFSKKISLQAVFVFIIFFSVFSFVGFNTVSAFGTEIPCISKGWPHDAVDLQPDPAVRYGTLDNGLRYVIMQNKEPKDRVGLYLNIQAGSLKEVDEQRGLAHFLEHMLFNGTTHYPPGTLVEYFQSIGMNFGSDTNAHTNFNETVYNILLPKGDRKHLDEGLLVIADYARGALLLEKEVDRERGIILAEKRTRDSVGYRLYEKKNQFFFEGTRVPERMPIGTEETLEKADADLLRTFYDSWYRPSNTIIVVVGDVNPDIAGELIKKHFSGFADPGIQPSCYEFGTVKEKGTSILYVNEPELGYTEVSVSNRWNESPSRDSKEFQQKDLENYVAALLMNNRLKKVVKMPESPVTNARIYSGIFLQRVGYTTITARTEAKKWQEGLELLNITLRQALTAGFAQPELDRVKKEIIADLEKQVKTKESRDSRKLAGDIIRQLNRNQVFLSPEQELELYKPMLDALTLDDVNRIFRDLWAPENRQVFVGGTADLGDATNKEDVVRSVFEKSETRELPAWVNGEAVAFPYLPIPDHPAAIIERKELVDIDAQQVRFENGTILNIKRTDFQPNEVLVSVHFGSGSLSEPLEGLAMLSGAVVRESGFGRLTKDELEEALAGKNVSLNFSIGQESFRLNGKGLNSEVELLLQLIQTQLLAPAFRDDAYQLSMERFQQMYEQLQSSVDGMMKLAGERFLAGGNTHYGLPEKDVFNALTLEQVRQWLAPAFDNDRLEVTIVGDIDLEKTIALTGRYLGEIERNKDFPENKEKIVFPVGKRLALNVASQIDKAQVVIAWSTDDFWDISRTRRLNVLASVFDDRLRVEIREKLGAVYSPVVYNVSSRVAEGYGVLRAIMTVDPKQAEEMANRVRETGANLASSGVTDEELTRALEPTLTSIKDMMRTNRYWLQSVLTLSSRHPEQLGWPLTIQDDFASIKTEDVSALASRFLLPEKSAEIVFSPEDTK